MPATQGLAQKRSVTWSDRRRLGLRRPGKWERRRSRRGLNEYRNFGPIAWVHSAAGQLVVLVVKEDTDRGAYSWAT